jgi:4a-hydroxytetrahydrobiopterin dehydratase
MEVMARPAKASEPEIADALARLPGWDRDGDEISRVFECASFANAIEFVVRIGFLAEHADHHPDLDVRWRKVRVALTTHDAGGITTLDLDMAAEITAAFTVPPAGAA